MRCTNGWTRPLIGWNVMRSQPMTYKPNGALQYSKCHLITYIENSVKKKMENCFAKDAYK